MRTNIEATSLVASVPRQFKAKMPAAWLDALFASRVEKGRTRGQYGVK